MAVLRKAAAADKPRKKSAKPASTHTAAPSTPAKAAAQPQADLKVEKKKKKKPATAIAAEEKRTSPSAVSASASPSTTATPVRDKGPGPTAGTGPGSAPRSSYEKGKPVLDDTRPTYFLFVDRLPYRLESPQIETELRELMRPLGTLRKLYRRKKAGFGYITFRSTRTLEALLQAMQNLQYDGRTLRIEPAKEDVAKKSVTEKSEYVRQVFLKNLPHDMTKDILKAFVQDSTGLEPQWVKLIQKSSAAFVTFATEEEAELCSNSLHGQRLLNQKISAERARPPPEKVPQLKPVDTTFEHLDVLLGPISVTVTEQHLTTVLTQVGCDVSQIKLLFNPHTGKFKECARILLADAASAQLLYNTFHGKMLFGRLASVEAFLGFADEGADFGTAQPDATTNNKRKRIERPPKPAKKANGATTP